VICVTIGSVHHRQRAQAPDGSLMRGHTMHETAIAGAAGPAAAGPAAEGSSLPPARRMQRILFQAYIATSLCIPMALETQACWQSSRACTKWCRLCSVSWLNKKKNNKRAQVVNDMIWFVIMTSCLHGVLTSAPWPQDWACLLCPCTKNEVRLGIVGGCFICSEL
jgi:hypothetical protein